MRVCSKIRWAFRPPRWGPWTALEERGGGSLNQLADRCEAAVYRWGLSVPAWRHGGGDFGVVLIADCTPSVAVPTLRTA